MHKLLLVFVTFACCRLSAYECPTTNIRIQSKLFVKTNNNDVAPPTLSPSPPPKTIIYPPKTGIRLNKALTSVHSRRAADRLIEEGRVKINGSLPLGRGDKVDPAIDIVTVDGEVVLVAEARDTQFVYIKFYKPIGVICTTDRRIKYNILDHLEHHMGESQTDMRLFPIGRLDKDSEGLILLSNDGRLPNSVLKGEHGVKKVYEVDLDRVLSEGEIALLREGVEITTVAQRDRGVKKELAAKTKPCGVVRGERPRSIVVTLSEGRNRQIRKMCAVVGAEVVKLRRTTFMGIGLGGIGIGAGRVWEFLNDEELDIVERAVKVNE